MRVLMIANTFPPGYTGGAEVVTYHTSRGLLARGIPTSVLVLNNRLPDRDERYTLDGIPVRLLFRQRAAQSAWSDLFDWRLYLATVAELRRLRPDIVHINNVSGATLAPYVACRTLGIPVVNTLHDLWMLCPNNMLYQTDGTLCDPYHPDGYERCFKEYDFWGALPYRLEWMRRLTANVRRFISPSQALIDRHVEAGYDPARFRLVRLGFPDVPPRPPEHPDVRALLARRGQQKVVAFGGGGVLIKGAQVLRDALPLLLRHVPDLQVVVAGPGDQSFFREWEPTIKVLGLLPFHEMRAFLHAADLTLIPSTCHENSPVTTFESYEAGTPVAASAFGGVQELIEPEQSGYLFPVGDSAALAATVIRHFARPAAERRQMRRRCVEKVRTELSFERHLAGVLAVYREVLAA